jgi:ATP-binding cassette subfamily B protein
MVQEAEASQKRINEFLSIEPEIQNNHPAPSVIHGEIQFKDVGFTYEDTNIKALEQINFHIKKRPLPYWAKPVRGNRQCCL